MDDEGWNIQALRILAAMIQVRHGSARVLKKEWVLPWRGPAIATWVERRLARRAVAPEEAPRSLERPAALEEALQHCQKPFQLWNVNREERDDPYELSPGPRMSLGRAAETPPELKVPRRLEGTSRLLRAHALEAVRERKVAASQKTVDWFLWRSPSPFGQPDPPPITDVEQAEPGAAPSRPPIRGPQTPGPQGPRPRPEEAPRSRPLLPPARPGPEAAPPRAPEPPEDDEPFDDPEDLPY